MSKELIRLKDCVMAYDDGVVLDHINLYINDKEFLTLLGPSGCGKTTTLRIIGGFLTPTSGDVLFDGVRINHVPPHKREVNTVFQKYALFPHLNVYENVAFGLRLGKTVTNVVNGKSTAKKVKIPEKEIHQRVMEMLEISRLPGLSFPTWLTRSAAPVPGSSRLDRGFFLLPACAGCSWGRVLPAPTQTDAGQWEPFPRQSAGGFCPPGLSGSRRGQGSR